MQFASSLMKDEQVRREALEFVREWRTKHEGTSLLVASDLHEDVVLTMEQSRMEDAIVCKALLESLLTQSLVVVNSLIDYECAYLMNLKFSKWVGVVPMCEAAHAVQWDKADGLREAVVCFIRRHQAWVWSSRLLVVHDAMRCIWKDCYNVGRNNGVPSATTLAFVEETLAPSKEVFFFPF